MEEISYKKYKQEIKEKWLDENDYHGTGLTEYIIPAKPDVGNFVKVDMLDIPKDIFPREFEQIIKSYYSVLKKLEKHYKKRHPQRFNKTI
jgi:hypothetical protein